MKQLIVGLGMFVALNATAQTVYFDSGDVYYLQEGEQVFITDQEWVFTVEKGGYMRGLFEFFRILPLCTYSEPHDGFTFGGSPTQPDCVSTRVEEEEEEEVCDNDFSFGGAGC